MRSLGARSTVDMATYRMSESLGNSICVYNCMSVLDLVAELRIIEKVADVCRSRCFEQARASSFRTVPDRRMTVTKHLVGRVAEEAVLIASHSYNITKTKINTTDTDCPFRICLFCGMCF